MEKGPEADPGRTGCHVFLRMQLSLQVSTTSRWIVLNNKHQIGYNGGVSYVGTRSYFAVQATPTTRRRPYHVCMTYVRQNRLNGSEVAPMAPMAPLAPLDGTNGYPLAPMVMAEMAPMVHCIAIGANGDGVHHWYHFSHHHWRQWISIGAI